MSMLLLAVSLFHWLLSPSFAFAASTADLSIKQSSISFSDDLVAGSTVRVYAQVQNVGDVDVDGFVTFYQGAAVLGQSLVISVRSGGVPEEVYVDFVVPAAAFNVRAVIGGTDPKDENDANDSAMTMLVTPVPDEDGDGIGDAEDTCASVANANQTDTDGDGLGNACDDDDDNDGVTDEVEKELGSNPLVSDTDGDGVSDAKDAYPTDKTRSKVEPVVVVPKPVAVAPAPAVVVAPVVTQVVAPVVTPSVPSAAAVTETAAVPAEEPPKADAEQIPSGTDTIPPAAIFQSERTAWNAYAFKAGVPEAVGYQFQWDFGDGVMSSRADVQHTYVTSGDFRVAFSVTDPSGATSSDAIAVHIPFWTLQNRIVDVIVGLLALLLLAGLGMVARLSRLSKVVARAAVAIGAVPPKGGTARANSIGEEDEALDRPKSKRLTVRNLDE